MHSMQPVLVFATYMICSIYFVTMVRKFILENKYNIIYFSAKCELKLSSFSASCPLCNFHKAYNAEMTYNTI